jgi:hypothetical protein
MDATHDNLSIRTGNMNFRSSGCAEFTIGDLLADPLTGALMRADRVNVSELEILLGSVASRIQARAPAQPIVAVKAAAEPRPSIPGYASGMFLPRRSEATTTRLSQAVGAVKASQVSCGSHCPW